MMASDGKRDGSGRAVDEPVEGGEPVIADAADSGDASDSGSASDSGDASDSANPAGSLTAWRQDAFWPDTVHACAPLAVWAGHFFGSYVFVAIACRAGLDSRAMLGLPLLTLGLLALTAGALAWLALMLLGRNSVVSLRRRRTQRMQRTDRPQRGPARARHPPGATAFRFGAASLSLVAVTWTTPPMMLIASCLQ